MGVSAYGGSFCDRCAGIDLEWQDASSALLQDPAEPLRPIFLFLGQALDSWSWLMADELAADEEVIELLRTAFVSVHGDSMTLPGMAALCQHVLTISANAQGWPAVLFLLPDGRPFGALPWSPMRDGQRRRGLATVLVEIAQLWHEHPHALEEGAAAMAEALDPLAQLPPGPQRSTTLIIDAAEAACLEAADTLEGGFGDAPRHLAVAPLTFLLQRAGQGSAAAATHLATSLNALLAGGIRDHLDGGFHRAAQDRAWNIPFFEKRAADTAQMIPLLLDAADTLDVPFYAAIARDSGEWLLSRLALPEGPVMHGLHALGPGGDGAPSAGGAYAWSQALAAAVVGSEAAERFARVFLSGPDIAPGFAVPAAKGERRGDDNEQLPAICARLAQARAERAQPWPDRRLFLADQGMLLVALARLHQWQVDHGEQSPAPWQGAAEAVISWLQPLLDDHGLPPLVWVDGQALGSADSHALAWLAWGWYCCRQWLALPDEPLQRWASALWALRRADGTLPVQPGSAQPGDELPALMDSDCGPSPAAVAGQVFRALAADDQQWAERSEQFIAAHRPIMALSPLPTSGLCSLL